MDLQKQINENKLVRRLALLWAVLLISAVVLITWLRPPDIPSSTVTAVGIVVGILATVIGFYQWSRGKDDEARAGKELGRDN
jgi:drug/metabolite transporter (DMT)-like permease